MRNFESVPPLLLPGDGKKDWEAKRETLLDTIAKAEYGCRPDLPYEVSWALRSRENVLDGRAERLITDLTVSTSRGSHTFPLYTFLPKSEQKVPATLLICSQARTLAPQKLPEGFSLDALPGIMQQLGIVMDGPMDLGGPRRALDLAVDMDNGHWPVPMLMELGHAVSGFYATDAQPDDAEFAAGLAPLFGTTKNRAEQEWGVLAIWAFAASCALDYLQTLPELGQVGVTGHSRCGKAALWAGATDPRFAWVMPNGSGCGGAAQMRGKHGENMASINRMMPYWFAPAFGGYVGRLDALPFDQHTVLALVAPRLLHVASGSEDFWADPAGEHHSAVLASQVYQLYGNPALPEAFPAADTPVEAGKLGYHLRTGPHLLTEYDWKCLAGHLAHAAL